MRNPCSIGSAVRELVVGKSRYIQDVKESAQAIVRPSPLVMETLNAGQHYWTASGRLFCVRQLVNASKLYENFFKDYIQEITKFKPYNRRPHEFGCQKGNGT